MIQIWHRKCICATQFQLCRRPIFSVEIILGIGAHSHIRGLGLDDALDPRQTSQGTIDFKFKFLFHCSIKFYHVLYQRSFWWREYRRADAGSALAQFVKGNFHRFVEFTYVSIRSMPLWSRMLLRPEMLTNTTLRSCWRSFAGRTTKCSQHHPSQRLKIQEHRKWASRWTRTSLKSRNHNQPQPQEYRHWQPQRVRGVRSLLRHASLHGRQAIRIAQNLKI